jgi:ATP-binding cassette, subfamily C, bacterial
VTATDETATATTASSATGAAPEAPDVVEPDDATAASRLLPTATSAATRRAVGRLLGRRRGLLSLTVFVLVAGTACGLAVPALLGRVVDVVADGAGRADLDRLVLGLVAATVAHGVLSGWGLVLVARLGERTLATLRQQVVERALTVSLEDVEAAGTGDLVARVGGDVDAVSTASREAFPELILSTLTIGLTVVGLAALDWRLGLAGLAAVPVDALAARRYLRRSGPVYAAERVAEGARAHQLHASIAGAATVRAFRLGPRHVERVAERSESALGWSLRAGRLRAVFFSRINGAELVGLSSILVVGFLLVRSGDVTVGQATAAALYFHRLFDPIGALLMLIDSAQSATAALARLVGVAGMAAPRPLRHADVAPASPLPVTEPVGSGERGEVVVAGVRFGYGDGPEVLHGVDLRVAPGEHVAVVGASGAGKTTLAKLVAGVHLPTAGQVRVDGSVVDGVGADADALRRAVALVTQEVHVFAGTLAEDLRLAAPDAEEDVLRAALATVGALGWVEALPDGLGTVVGEGGQRLSATQAQQLALARMVLADPAVAILDEATAEAGSAGARSLEASARSALRGRTALVVAHRLTQAASADRIVVLDGGRIVEEGTHDELRTAGGPYAQLWSAWRSVR